MNLTFSKLLSLLEELFQKHLRLVNLYLLMLNLVLKKNPSLFNVIKESFITIDRHASSS